MPKNVTIPKTSILLNQSDQKNQSLSNDDDEEYDLDHLKSFIVNENEHVTLFKKKITPQNLESTSKNCKICLNKFSDENSLYQLDNCKCTFCIACMNQYIYQCIENCDVLPIYCPDSKCVSKGIVTQSEIKFLIQTDNSSILDGNNNINAADSICFIDCENENLINNTTKKGDILFKRYLKLYENIEILRDPNRRHCPAPDCQSICEVKVDPSTSSNVKVTCEICKHQFCSNCSKKWMNHENSKNDFYEFSGENNCECGDLTFDKSDSGGGDGLFENFENIKRCPKCGVLIERADGCAQIMCKVCKHTFCFYCLASLDNDFLLKHFTKNGPCKGKLGHSKLSLFVHRLGVVAIFSGTVFLVIILSPIILLSLPCLIFSNKCRKTCLKFSTKFS